MLIVDFGTYHGDCSYELVRNGVNNRLINRPVKVMDFIVLHLFHRFFDNVQLTFCTDIEMCSRVIPGEDVFKIRFSRKHWNGIYVRKVPNQTKISCNVIHQS